MAQPVWQTLAGNLGVIAENVFYTLNLVAQDPDNQTITYSLVSGALPPGIRLNSAGTLSGVPTKVTSNSSNQTTFNSDVSSRFTVRAKTTTNNVADQSFSVTVTGEVAPIITAPTQGSLGQFYTGEFISIQIVAADSIPGAILTYSIVNGALPAGVTLNETTGLISGHIIENPPASGLIQGWDETPYDKGLFDFNSVNADANYKFTIAVTDGIQNVYATYYFLVVAKNSLTADNTQLTADDAGIPTADEDTLSIPFLTTIGPNIGTSVSGDYFAFQFHATDPDGDAITFQVGTFLYINTTHITCDSTKYTCDASELNSNLPPGLKLDSQTGWVYGLVPPLTIGTVTFNFTMVVYKTQFPSYISLPVTYNLVIEGTNANIISWITPSNLGSMNNGDTSMFSIQAVSSSGAGLSYSIAPDSASKLPDGLQLQQDGLIVGRASFEIFTLDHATTTIDGGVTTFDATYTFVIQATDSTQTAISTREFVITVKPTYLRPYDDLYLFAYQDTNPRNDFTNFINNPTIFPESSIYRFNDTFFGVSQNLNMLVLSGINPVDSDVYLAAMQKNHYRKQLWMGNVKTAMATDSNGNPLYEVVYVEAVDPLINASSAAGLNVPTPQALSKYAVVETVIGPVYPNSIEAMRDQIAFGNLNLNAITPVSADGVSFTADDTNNTADATPPEGITTNIGLETYAQLPLWMTSIQPNGSILGFTQAFVICYTNPGQSSRIVYNIQQSNYDFQENYFLVDKYVLDDALSINYNTSTGSFLPSAETTFDKFTTVASTLPIVTTVNYAVSTSYNSINGQTISSINANGGLDGSMISSANDNNTIIFAKQEFYDGILDPNFGWYSNGQEALSLSLDTSNITFDSTLFTYDMVYKEVSTSAFVIPGYTQVQLGQSLVNMRSGVWQISINPITEIVTLAYKINVKTNQSVNVLNGNTYAGKNLFYNPIIESGSNVPEYDINLSVILGHETTFDMHTTRFYDNKDTYMAFGDGDTFLEFPKYNILA